MQKHCLPGALALGIALSALSANAGGIVLPFSSAQPASKQAATAVRPPMSRATTDPIFDKTGGCVASPLPAAPADATRITRQSRYTKGTYQLAYWFQPCTQPNSTLPYKAVLLMEATLTNGTPDESSGVSEAITALSQDGQASPYPKNAVSYLGQPSGNIAKPTTFLVSWLNQRAGSYNVDPSRPVTLLAADASTISTTVLIPVIPTTSTTGSVVPATNWSGVWWNAAEGGQGYTLFQYPSSGTFFTWYGYTDNGQALWYYSSDMKWTSTTTLSGPFSHTSYNGNGALTGAFNPLAVASKQDGTATIQFNGADAATLTYVINGVPHVKQLVRFQL